MWICIRLFKGYQGVHCCSIWIWSKIWNILDSKSTHDIHELQTILSMVNRCLWHDTWIISNCLTNILSRSQIFPHTYHQFMLKYQGYSWQGAWIFVHRLGLFWGWKGENINDKVRAKYFECFHWVNSTFWNIAICRTYISGQIWRWPIGGFTTWRIGQGLPSFKGTIIIYFI